MSLFYVFHINNNKKYITHSTLSLSIVICPIIIHFIAIAAVEVVAIVEIVMADQ